MVGRVYTLREYVEIMNDELWDFSEANRLAAIDGTAGNEARPLDEWDRMFDDFAAEWRSELGIS